MAKNKFLSGVGKAARGIGNTALNGIGLVSPSLGIARSAYNIATGLSNKKGNQKAKKPAKQAALEEYDVGSAGDSGYSSGGSGGYSYGGGSSRSTYDASIDAFQKAYDASVGAARTANAQTLKELSDNINRTREDIARSKDEYNKYYDDNASNLLKSIERFRESNAQNVADQKKAYLANQASLESARAEADRQSRISAAARGLGGSGLQQLAQLQNLVNQSQDISDAATQNQGNMEKLRLALSQAEEDYNDRLKKSEDARKTELDKLNTTLARAEQDYTTNVNKANDNLRDLIAKYEAAKASNDVSALSELYSGYGGSGRGGRGRSSSDTDDYADIIVGGLKADQADFENALASLGSSTKKANQKTAKDIYNKYVSKTNDYLRNYGNKYSSLVNTSTKNLKTTMKNRGY